MRMSLLAVVAALVAASAAAATPPPTKGKPAPTGANCKPQVMLVLKGTVSSNGHDATGMDMLVTGGNAFAKNLKGDHVHISFTASTKVTRGNSRNAVDIAKDDVVLVQAKVCKADLTSYTHANANSLHIGATKVVARAPSS